MLQLKLPEVSWQLY